MLESVSSRKNISVPVKIFQFQDMLRDRSLFMAGGGTEEKCFSWQKFC